MSKTIKTSALPVKLLRDATPTLPHIDPILLQEALGAEPATFQRLARTLAGVRNYGSRISALSDSTADSVSTNCHATLCPGSAIGQESLDSRSH